jgi:peptide/nickel transport system ATP-binding protein
MSAPACTTAGPGVRCDDLVKTFDVSAPWLNRVIERKPKQFVHAVDGVSFDIPRGKTLGAGGRIGLRQKHGRALLVGLYGPAKAMSFRRSTTPTRSLASPRPRALRQRMQMIFQDPYASLNPRWKVRDIVAEPLIEHGL